jgi:hypothetical protein
LQDPPKFTQIGIFGLKTNHLATLLSVASDFHNSELRLLSAAKFPALEMSKLSAAKVLISTRALEFGP